LTCPYILNEGRKPGLLSRVQRGIAEERAARKSEDSEDNMKGLIDKQRREIL
jgi:hypothetical protein